MNLKPLFEMQKPLDDRIVKEKGLEGQDLLPKKILALQVELGELANEWRGFKFWSNDQEPRRKVYGTSKLVVVKEPILEEYVDCLHFILSIGLEINEIQNKPVDTFNYWAFENPFGITQTFRSMMAHFNDIEDGDGNEIYIRLFCEFIGLGSMLGFTWEQIEQSYYEKNKINHTRQDNGY